MRPSICVLLGTLKPPAIDKVDLGWERPRNGRRSRLRKRGGIVARGTGYTALSSGKLLSGYAGRRSKVKMLVGWHAPSPRRARRRSLDDGARKVVQVAWAKSSR